MPIQGKRAVFVQARAVIRAHQLQTPEAQLRDEARIALAMALHYLRLPIANVPAAARKTVQALGALNRLMAQGVKHV